jgi:hypothetical protein
MGRSIAWPARGMQNCWYGIGSSPPIVLVSIMGAMWASLRRKRRLFWIVGGGIIVVVVLAKIALDVVLPYQKLSATISDSVPPVIKSGDAPAKQIERIPAPTPVPSEASRASSETTARAD